jgi:hypothetical protein
MRMMKISMDCAVWAALMVVFIQTPFVLVVAFPLDLIFLAPRLVAVNLLLSLVSAIVEFFERNEEFRIHDLVDQPNPQTRKVRPLRDTRDHGG